MRALRILSCWGLPRFQIRSSKTLLLQPGLISEGLKISGRAPGIKEQACVQSGVDQRRGAAPRAAGDPPGSAQGVSLKLPSLELERCQWSSPAL